MCCRQIILSALFLCNKILFRINISLKSGSVGFFPIGIKISNLFRNYLSQLTDSYDNYEDLCKAIKDITQIDDRHRYSYDFLHLNNKLLAGLLFSKVNAALKKDIQIIVTIFNYDYTSSCSDMEIIDLAGVLIDNAIEACRPDDTIFISIGQRTEYTKRQFPYQS